MTLRDLTLIPRKNYRHDVVFLPFEATIEPGETAEVWPTKATRFRATATEEYLPAEDVAPGTVRPFRTARISPLKTVESAAGWRVPKGIYFTAVYLDGSGKSDLSMETSAYLVAGCGSFSTSPSAGDVHFKVVNRGPDPVVFTGQIEGRALGEVVK